jgi:methylated-DNA-[protein]-cysteine S-methyltransferase
MDDVLPDRYTMDRISTPIGVALFVTDARGALSAFDWADYEDRLSLLFRRGAGASASLTTGRAPEAVRSALARYFDGEVGVIDALTCAAPGTAFQKKVWDALRTIPTGTTLTYGALAARIGAPKAARAVGLANNRNPIAVVVPCHRVIGADRSLTGYAGGLERKRWLLEHEARHTRHDVWMASTALASSTSSGESLSMRAMSAR